MGSMHGIRNAWLTVCVVAAMTAGLSTSSAKAARLGHPAYSASGATASQTQWNLVCDPAGAISGSTSTSYDPNVASLNTITAAPGFQIDKVVIVFQGEGPFAQTFGPFPPGTPSFSLPADTFSQWGLVQVYWSPLVIASAIPAAAVSGKSPTNGNGDDKGGGDGKGDDVVTHFITFDSVNPNPPPGLAATFTNFASAPNNIYGVNADSYTVGKKTYTWDQIDSAKTTLHLLVKGDKDGKGDDKGKGDEKGKGNGDDKGGK